MSETVVRFRDVSKRFRMGQVHDSLRDLIASCLKRLVGRSQSEANETFWALRNVDFEANRGEAVGIIGPNGAGKSTALRLLAGILRPNGGTIEATGRLAALIEVGAGFHGDLTGRENIFLSGAIMGMDRREICRKLETIVAFSGIERFLDMPVKRYSSGMYARLGFSIAAHVDPDILLVDEVLSVGDAVFRLRCVERMRELVRRGTTLIFVTHNLEQMQAICPRAIVLESGRVTFDGPSRDAVGQYMTAMSRTYAKRPTDVPPERAGQEATVELTALRFLDAAGEEIVWIRPREAVRIELIFRLHRPIPRLVVELNMRAAANENVLSFNSARDDLIFAGTIGVHRLTLDVAGIPLSGGQYFWNVRMWDADRGTTELDTPLKFPMVIDDEGRATGTLSLDHEWTLETEPADRGCTPEAPGMATGKTGVSCGL